METPKIIKTKENVTFLGEDLDDCHTHSTIDEAVEDVINSNDVLVDQELKDKLLGMPQDGVVHEEIVICHFEKMAVSERNRISSEASILIGDYVENLDEEYQYEDHDCIDKDNPLVVSAAEHFLKTLFHFYKPSLCEPNGETTKVRVAYYLECEDIQYYWKEVTNDGK